MFNYKLKNIQNFEFYFSLNWFEKIHKKVFLEGTKTQTVGYGI